MLRAPRARVWRALTDSAEFGRGFEVSVDRPFVPGARVTMVIRTKGYEGLTFPVLIERVEPQRLFSWRWHPGTEQPADGDPAQMTQVVFTLEEVPEGTQLTVVEDHFENVDLARRAEAFRMNTEGWEFQLKNIERHVGSAQ